MNSRTGAMTFTIEGSPDGRRWPVHGEVWPPAAADSTRSPAPVVAVAHELLGSMHAAPGPAIAKAVCERGMSAVLFSFSACGGPAGREGITDDLRFAGDSFARRIDDLARVVTAIFERVLPGGGLFDNRRIGVAGFEAGAAVAVIEAATDSRVRAVAALATPPRLEAALPEGVRAAGAWREEHDFIDARSGRRLRFGAPLFRDLRARERGPSPDGAPRDVAEAIRALDAPLFLIHPSDDPRAPLADIRRHYFGATARAELEVIGRETQDLRGDPGESDAARATAVFLGGSLF